MKISQLVVFVFRRRQKKSQWRRHLTRVDTIFVLNSRLQVESLHRMGTILLTLVVKVRLLLSDWIRNQGTATSRPRENLNFVLSQQFLSKPTPLSQYNSVESRKKSVNIKKKYFGFCAEKFKGY